MKALAFILLILLLLLQYKLWFSPGGLPEVWQLGEARKQQVLENAELEQRNQSLSAEVQDLKEGRDAIEERARSEMGMIKKGETFYQVVPETKQAEEQ
jgi:cell division protein FtsB